MTSTPSPDSGEGTQVETSSREVEALCKRLDKFLTWYGGRGAEDVSKAWAALRSQAATITSLEATIAELRGEVARVADEFATYREAVAAGASGNYDQAALDEIERLTTNVDNARALVRSLDKQNAAYAGELITVAKERDQLRTRVAELEALTSWTHYRRVLAHGATIHQDFVAGNHKTYEHFAAHIDSVAREYSDAALSGPPDTTTTNAAMAAESSDLAGRKEG